MAIKECVICGLQFDAHGPQKTCSKECKLARERERDRSKRAANPEKYREYARSKRAANPEKYRSFGREAYLRRKEDAIVASRMYYSNNAEAINEKKKQERRNGENKHKIWDKNSWKKRVGTDSWKEYQRNWAEKHARLTRRQSAQAKATLLIAIENGELK